MKPEDRVRGDGGSVPLEVSERHFVEIDYSPGSDDDSGEVCAVFRTKRQWREGEVDCGNQWFSKPATPEGLRDLIGTVRKMAKDLRARGVCPRCPDPASAFLRVPTADFCPPCCLAAAITED